MSKIDVLNSRVFGNPVFRRESRTAFRSWKMYIAVMSYALTLAGVAAIALYIFTNASSYNGFNPQNMVYLYIVLASFQNFLASIITPSLAGASISGERERQTLDLMLITKMSTVSVILGKLASSILVVLLMMIASLPVFSLLLYYGGVSLWHLFGMTIFTIAYSAFTGSVSILFSSITKKTILAIVLTYITMLVLTVGNIVFIIVFALLSSHNSTATLFHFWFIFISATANPVAGFISVLENQIGFSFMRELFNDIYSSISYSYTTSSGLTTPNSVYNVMKFYDTVPIWLINGFYGLAATAGCTLLSAHIIQPAKRKI